MQLESRGIEAAPPAWVGSTEVGELGSQPVALRGQVRNDALIDRDPALIELNPDRPSRSTGDLAPPSRVPPTPANGSSTVSPVRLKNSISRAISRGGLLAPWAFRAACPNSDG